jgi:hypothetical protein
MKKKSLTLFVRCSQPTSYVPHKLYCIGKETITNFSSALEQLMSKGEIAELKKDCCKNAPDEVVENNPINPHHVTGITFAIHPKDIPGVYSISFELSQGKYSWVYTDRASFDTDKTFFDKLIASTTDFPL